MVQQHPMWLTSCFFFVKHSSFFRVFGNARRWTGQFFRLATSSINFNMAYIPLFHIVRTVNVAYMSVGYCQAPIADLPLLNCCRGTLPFRCCLPLGLKSSGQHAWSLLLLLSELAHALLPHVVSLLQFLLHGCIVHYHIFARSVHGYHMKVLQFANAGSHPLAAGCSWQKGHHPSDPDSVTTTERVQDAAWSVMASLLVSNK